MPSSFGKYRLQKRLGVGGMGEVFLAEARDGAGAPGPAAGQPVVLKRILPHLTGNARFLRLFLDEARVAARLNHPNIAQIFELGQADGTWYVAMEYVAGRDLRQVARAAAVAGRPVPVGVACGIAAQVAAALDYAHRATGPNGRPLKIVHRDVSPHNVLVGFDGAVKLVDFGVAKAVNRATHTQPGVLKGKFPYMAPEQAEGARIDRRVDIFALGITVWELLAARPLFRGKSDAVTLKNVKTCAVPPPSGINPAVPHELDELLLKALSRAPKGRFQTAAEFRAALDELVVARQLAASHSDIAAYLRELAPQFEADEASASLVGSAELETQTVSRHQGRPIAQPGDRATEPGPPGPFTASEPGPLGSRPPPAAGLRRTPSAVRLLEEVAQRATNLARQPTSFVGRVGELAELHQLIRAGARLITLVGSGGTGKTRLALQLASQQLPSFDVGGVWFCDLTDARDLDGVCAGVGRTLDVPLPPGKPGEGAAALLGQVLAGRGELLLVLDNLEQAVGPAAEAVERWLSAAPAARFVATSRERLRVPGEVLFEVPPLKLPEAGEPVASSEAVMLFVTRAEAARPSYRLTKADEAAVADIVRQLDGLPLAIELAAARLAVLTPAQLAERLPRRFELLGGRPRDGQGRQATLAGAIDWSWQLLTPPEQAALAQCSLFRGGFTAEAAEAVLAPSHGQKVASATAMAALTALRAKSLVRAYFTPGAGAAARFGLYETIREFARARLDATRDETGAVERHARYYVLLGERLAARAEGNVAALEALALERENLNAVFQWGLGGGAGAVARGLQALRAVLALDPLLTLRGPLGTHLLMLDAALEKAADGDPLLLARGYEARGKARLALWRLDEAVEDFQSMLLRAQRHRSPELEGRAHLFLGVARRLMGRHDDARAEAERALLLQRQVGDRRMEGRTLANLGILLEEQGRSNEAVRLYAQALEIHREVGDRRFEGIILSNLGVLQQHHGLLAAARENYEGALAIHRELGNRRSEAIALMNLGDLHREQGNGPPAAALYERALALDREVGDRRFEGVVLASMGSLELERGRGDEAVTRLRQALTVLREVGDRPFEGLALGALGAALAATGALAEAADCFDRAEAVLRDTADAGLGEALDVYRGHLELARSTEAARSGRMDRAAELAQAAALRVRRAQSPGGPSPEHPKGRLSPAKRSEDVRAALRSLEAVHGLDVRRVGPEGKATLPEDGT